MIEMFRTPSSTLHKARIFTFTALLGTAGLIICIHPLHAAGKKGYGRAVTWAFNIPGENSGCNVLLLSKLGKSERILFASYRPTHPAVAAILDSPKTSMGFYDGNYCTDCIFKNPFIKPVRLGVYNINSKRRWYVMHHKFVILKPRDEPSAQWNEIITGSFNWNTKSARRNYDDIVAVKSAILAAAFKKEIDHLNGLPASDEIVIDGNMACAFNAQCDDLLVREIRKARKSILAAIYIMNPTTQRRPNTVYNELIRASQRGVRVRVITDARKVSKRGYGSLEIIQARVPNGDMHHKFCIIDNSVVLTGSFNYIYKAMTGNMENIIAVKDPLMAKAYTRHWNYMYKKFKEGS